MSYNIPIKVFDFYAGCGGTSKGFSNAGLDTVFAIDNDETAARTFTKNFPNIHLRSGYKHNQRNPLEAGDYVVSDIHNIPVDALKPIIDECQGHAVLFSGCAPCQPFSQQKTRLPEKDARKALLSEFQRFVEYYTPEYIFIENVPGMQYVAGQDGPFDHFLKMLERNRYHYRYKVLLSQRYGVPQKRRRLVLIASRLDPIDFPPETHGPNRPNSYATVKEWMDGFPKIQAGQTHPDFEHFPNHQASALSKLNLRRIKATPIGGDRRDWPQELWLACHSNGYNGHQDVYGRLKWHDLASCLTTKCNSYTNGRFGHPEEHRAISIREAACLQTFPRDYVLDGGIASMAKQIGNAVPVLLAERFGENFNSHLKHYLEKKENGEV